MITSVPGLPETGLPLIPLKLKKLFFIGLLRDILIFRLLCRKLNELHSHTLLGFDITSTLSTSVYVDRILKQMKKAFGETQTLRAGCSKTEPKIFAPPQTPSRGRRTAKI